MKRHRATPSPAKNRPERPPTSGRRKTASGHRQTAGERREGDTPTPRARAHTSRTAADMYAHEGATRVVIAAYSIYIYIYIYAATALYCAFIYYILFIAFFFLLFMVLFAPLFRACIMRACDIAAPMYIYAIFMYIYL